MGEHLPMLVAKDLYLILRHFLYLLCAFNVILLILKRLVVGKLPVGGCFFLDRLFFAGYLIRSLSELLPGLTI
jgi:hypothetical protein